MTTDELEPMDAELRSLVAIERAVPAAPSAGRARVSARLDATLFGPGGPGSGGDGGATPPATPPSGGATAPGGVAGAAAGSVRGAFVRTAAIFLLGGVVGAGLGLVWKPRVELVERIVYVPAEPATVAAPRVIHEPVIAPSAEPSASASVEPRASAGPARVGTDSLDAERTVLDPARTALGRRDGQSALDAARKHEARFPSGKLAEEREAIAVQALVLLHRGDEARTRALRFRQRYPGSVLAPAVDAALESASSPE